MAEQTYFIGSTGPFTYDDANFPAALRTTGVIRSDAVPSGGSDVLRLDDVGGGGVVAPTDAKYVVISLDGDLSDERVLAVNTTNLTLTDGGANGDITLDTVQNINTGATPTFAGMILSGNYLLANGNYIGISAAERLEFYTAGYAAFMGCNVGIGTDTPNNKLTLKRDTAITEGDINTYLFGLKRINSDTNAFGIGVDSNSDIILATNNAKLRIGRVASSTFNEYIRIDGIGNVGIGTDSPKAPLEVAGEIAAKFGGGFTIFISDADDPRFNMDYASGVATTRLTGVANAHVSIGAGGVDDILFVHKDGNVGIGTVNPTDILDIEKSSNFDVYITGTGGSNNVGLFIKKGTDSSAGLRLGLNNTEHFLWGYENIRMAFATNNTRAMTIDASQNVGIGTASPLGLLHLEGADVKIHILETGATADEGRWQWRYNVDSMSLDAVNDANNAGKSVFLVTRSGITPTLSLNKDGGNVGIGASPNAAIKLDVVDATAGSSVISRLIHNNNANTGSHARLAAQTGGASGGDPLLLLTVGGVTDWSIGVDNSDSDKLKIGSSSAVGTSTVITLLTGGKVGIGTDSPVEKLDVFDGDITLSSSNQAIVNGTDLGSYKWFANDDTFGEESELAAQIQYIGIGTWTGTLSPASLNFLLKTSADVSPSVKMTIEHSGRVGIGLIPTVNMSGLSIEAGVLTIKETTTPTADVNYGKIYTKNTNKLFFQDGAGVEHELAYA